MSNYWENAILGAEQAKQYENIGNYDVAFAMYKAAIICLLSGIEEDNDANHRLEVKEKTSQYLFHAERIYNNHLVFRYKTLQCRLPKIPWRNRLQLRRYMVVNSIGRSLLVYDSTENNFVVIKGIQKTSSSINKNEICILPQDVPYMVKLFAIHETDTTVFFILEYIRYGRLWDQLEHHFLTNSCIEELDTEVSSSIQQDNGGNGNENEAGSPNDSSYNSNDSSNIYHSLSRLESSLYTGATSCESLSSRDDSYFDLIEDYARIKNKKLKEVMNFGDKWSNFESVKQIKRTCSQSDIKFLSDSFQVHKSHSLSNLMDQNVNFNLNLFSNQNISSVDEYRLYSCKNVEKSDTNTVNLLRNAQLLIDSINDTLSKNEHTEKESLFQLYKTNMHIERDDTQSNDMCSFVYEDERLCHLINYQHAEKVYSRENNRPTLGDCMEQYGLSEGILDSDVKIAAKVLKLKSCSPGSPNSGSIASVTEDYSFITSLKKNGITPELIKNWATQILVAIETLHQSGIICRDLNPNNILLLENGSIKLTYFFRYPNVDISLNISAKEKLYVAPEVINIHSQVTFASDWWSFGAILYELVTSQSLYQRHPEGIRDHTIIYFPDKIQSEMRSLLLELLKVNPEERLGSGICGVDDIKAHPYFNGTNWKDI